MEAKSTYVSGAKIKGTYGISTRSLQRWADEGKVKSIRTPGGNRLYDSTDVDALFGGKQEFIKKKICYARVSSDKQKEDLARQVESLKEIYPDHEIITDIGSGLNFKRKGLNTLLDLVHDGKVAEICVMYKDRLCRFGIELVEYICRKAGTRIVVHRDEERSDVNNAQELSEDLLSIVTVFVARNNGLRAGQNRRRRKKAQETKDEEAKEGGSEGESTSGESEEDSDLSNKRPKRKAIEMVRNSEMDIQSSSRGSEKRSKKEQEGTQSSMHQ